MLQHHARLSCPCSKHDDHVTHLISADDSAWLLARILRAILRDGGLNGVECSTWKAHDNGMPLSYTTADEEQPPYNLT